MFPCFFFFCFLAQPPAPVIQDGAGGYVPFTNSRVMPSGELRPYDPAIDGIMGPDGSVYFPVPPQPYPYQPQGLVTVGPPSVMPARPTPRRPRAWVDPNPSPEQLDTAPAYEAPPVGTHGPMIDHHEPYIPPERG